MKTKPPKRKPPTIGQIRAWLKSKGHAAEKADKLNTIKDVISLHGEVPKERFA